jgi:predicted permease
MSWRRFFRRTKWDRERHAEIESYVQIETDANIARGMPLEEARHAARKKFGNPTLVREEIYRMNTIGFLDALARSLRYSLRTLRQNPTFTAIALLTLAIGIGANTAIFSVVNSVLLKPLAYPNADELVALRQTASGAAGLATITDGFRLSASMYFTYHDQNRMFQSLGAWSPSTASVTGFTEPEEIRTVLITDGTLQALGIAPTLGRWLGAADQTPGGPETVMLAYGYWQRRFGGSTSVVGQTIRVDARPREIVGVMPRGFRFVNTDSDLILPFAFDRSKLSLPGFFLQGIGRLKPGATIAQANADLARLLPVWMDSWPFDGNPRIYETWRITPALLPLKQEAVGNVSDVLRVVMGTIGIVMLIACANVANLLLVRADARQQELAVRAALGAGWGRIVRELLLESLVLGVIGGALGLVLAYAGLSYLVALGPATLPRLSEISLDARAFAFTFVLSLISGLLFGLIPALKYAGPRISLTLRSAGRNASSSRERHRTRNLLVVVQVAMALVLLVSAGLMIRTFQALRTVEPGFTHAEQLQTVRVSIPFQLIPEPERVTRTQNDILDKLHAIPGVISASCINAMPMEGAEPDWDVVVEEGKTIRPGEIPPLRTYKYVSPGYFHTAGTKLIAGRDYTWTDLYDRRLVTIVSENLARELWGSPSAALGKRFRAYRPETPLREVIGVVQDVRDKGIQEPAPSIVYWPILMQNLYLAGQPRIQSSVVFAIRSDRAGTEAFLNQIQQSVWSANSNLAVANVRTMQEVYDKSLARTSFTLVMLAIAGSMALVLGIIGIYGVLSYAVSQRRREIGIRLALGAQPGELKTMFVRHGLVLAGIGVAIGLGAAAGLTRLMSSLLFGIKSLDPITYAAGALILGLAAVLASYLPARRASAVDPVEALKAE